MKKIVILGASFDPPHYGHMTMAREIVRRKIAEKVILVPCGNHAFTKEISPANDRCEMARLMVEELVRTEGPFFELSDTEIKRKGVSYAWDTLQEMSKSNPDCEVGWLIGSDQLKNFSKWYKYQEILSKYTVYVYPREGYMFAPFYPGMIRVRNVPMVQIASRQVRADYLAGKNPTGLVLPDVAKYIEEKKLWSK